MINRGRVGKAGHCWIELDDFKVARRRNSLSSRAVARRSSSHQPACGRAPGELRR